MKKILCIFILAIFIVPCSAAPTTVGSVLGQGSYNYPNGAICDGTYTLHANGRDFVITVTLGSTSKFYELFMQTGGGSSVVNVYVDSCTLNVGTITNIGAGHIVLRNGSTLYAQHKTNATYSVDYTPIIQSVGDGNIVKGQFMQSNTSQDSSTGLPAVVRVGSVEGGPLTLRNVFVDVKPSRAYLGVTCGSAEVVLPPPQIHIMA